MTNRHRRRRWVRAATACCATVLTACTASVHPTLNGIDSPTPVPPAPYVVPFAPYVDVTAAHPGLASAVRQSPARRFVLAFLRANGSRCQPVWGEDQAVADPGLRAEAAAVRASGGGVTVATGGASGTYLETTCHTSAELTAAYRQGLAMTGADRLDVDVERTVPINLVADALTAVHRELGVALTVTVMVVAAAEGLAQDTMSLLRALATRGTDVTVNAMVMNFPAGQSWHDSLTAAAETVTGQISQVWPAGGRPGAYHRLGLTVMAGRNDTGVITTLDDARAVGQYANQHQIGFLGLWSLGRDNGGCPGQRVARHNCSGIAQGTFDFIRVLAKAVS